jgi:hypothetical protein
MSWYAMCHGLCGVSVCRLTASALPGGGWRGYDPTQHEVVAGNHIPLAASCLPEEITPVFGTYRGAATSKLMTEVFIRRI